MGKLINDIHTALQIKFKARRSHDNALPYTTLAYGYKKEILAPQLGQEGIKNVLVDNINKILEGIDYNYLIVRSVHRIASPLMEMIYVRVIPDINQDKWTQKIEELNKQEEKPLFDNKEKQALTEQTINNVVKQQVTK